jgi:hypothetical protein
METPTTRETETRNTQTGSNIWDVIDIEENDLRNFISPEVTIKNMVPTKDGSAYEVELDKNIQFSDELVKSIIVNRYIKDSSEKDIGDVSFYFLANQGNKVKISFRKLYRKDGKWIFSLSETNVTDQVKSEEQKWKKLGYELPTDWIVENKKWVEKGFNKKQAQLFQNPHYETINEFTYTRSLEAINPENWDKIKLNWDEVVEIISRVLLKNFDQKYTPGYYKFTFNSSEKELWTVDTYHTYFNNFINSKYKFSYVRITEDPSDYRKIQGTDAEEATWNEMLTKENYYRVFFRESKFSKVQFFDLVKRGGKLLTKEGKIATNKNNFEDNAFKFLTHLGDQKVNMTYPAKTAFSLAEFEADKDKRIIKTNVKLVNNPKESLILNEQLTQPAPIIPAVPVVVAPTPTPTPTPITPSEDPKDKELKELQAKLNEAKKQAESLSKEKDKLITDKESLVKEKDKLTSEKEGLVKEKETLSQTLAQRPNLTDTEWNKYKDRLTEAEYLEKFIADTYGKENLALFKELDINHNTKNDNDKKECVNNCLTIIKLFNQELVNQGAHWKVKLAFANTTKDGTKINYGNDKLRENTNGVSWDYPSENRSQVYIKLDRYDWDKKFEPGLVYWTLAHELSHSYTSARKITGEHHGLDFWNYFLHNKEPHPVTEFTTTYKFLRQNLVKSARRDMLEFSLPSEFSLRVNLNETLKSYFPETTLKSTYENYGLKADKPHQFQRTKEIKDISIKVVDDIWKKVSSTMLELAKNGRDSGNYTGDKAPLLWNLVHIDRTPDGKRFMIYLSYHQDSSYQTEIEQLVNWANDTKEIRSAVSAKPQQLVQKTTTEQLLAEWEKIFNTDNVEQVGLLWNKLVNTWKSLGLEQEFGHLSKF